jgi:hypothetical protein
MKLVALTALSSAVTATPSKINFEGAQSSITYAGSMTMGGADSCTKIDGSSTCLKDYMATQEANMKALIIGSTICPDGSSINASSFAIRQNVNATTDYCTKDPVPVDFYGTTNQPVCSQ